MHEFSVTQSILEIALRHADGAKISNITLVIGQLSSFVDESVQFYWEMICQDTIAAGSTLHFRRIPAQLHCRNCQQTYGLDGKHAICPSCGGADVEIIAGDEFFVESIDIEES
jgi:hydrogenase nickel incorporation protein HypA/HybF